VCVFNISVPNVSFEVYSPSFLDKFLESHSVMTQVLLPTFVKLVIQNLGFSYSWYCFN